MATIENHVLSSLTVQFAMHVAWCLLPSKALSSVLGVPCSTVPSDLQGALQERALFGVPLAISGWPLSPAVGSVINVRLVNSEMKSSMSLTLW